MEFGAFDRAVLDVVFNQHKPTYLAPGRTVFHYGTASTSRVFEVSVASSGHSDDTGLSRGVA